MITVEGFSYIPSTQPYLKQGVKGNCVPKGSVGGSNGSFIMAGNPPQIRLEIKSSNGDYSSVDCYSFVKDNSNRRVTEKYATAICSSVVGKSFENTQALNKALYEKIE